MESNMSEEAVFNLFETMDKDPDLSQRLTAIEDPAEVARIAESELGLNVTAEELISAVASIQNSEDESPKDELNEEELEAVAGGRCIPRPRRWPPCRGW
ncbi:MAG: Nif11-like leader peptide family RiPP precursor [Coleofasciculus sp. G3-WIS-01]|uniref:Nif11-like leader peptide family RiPP precursor n=1 Tax=Coleofasciculus sp. G3-WIS-01 TaxID=3069528 RepID=UPI0032FBBCD2